MYFTRFLTVLIFLISSVIGAPIEGLHLKRNFITITVELEGLAVQLQQAYWRGIVRNIGREPRFAALSALIRSLTDNTAYKTLDQFKVLVANKCNEVGLVRFKELVKPAKDAIREAEFARLDHDVSDRGSICPSK